MTLTQALAQPIDTMTDHQLDLARESVGAAKLLVRKGCESSICYGVVPRDYKPPKGQSYNADIASTLAGYTRRIDEINATYFRRADDKIRSRRKAA